MKRVKAKRLFGGLAAILAALLTLGIGCTSLMFQWEMQVNAALGITVDNTVSGGDDSIDTVYYKSSFGDISALYKSNPTQAEKEALAKAQTDLIAAEKAFAIREQEEGSVLLKNKQIGAAAALPLAEDERSVTLFGNASGNPLWRSSSAGSNPNDSLQSTGYAQAFRDAGFTINETLQSALEKSGVKRVRAANGQADIGEVPVSFYDPYKNTFDQNNDVAIVIFVRTAGEGFDMNTRDVDGVPQLSLHQEEKDLLQMIESSGRFGKTVVLIGGGYPMELGWLDEAQYGVDACLWIGEPGMYGFEGVVNLLTGEANPSGRLVDTYAVNSMSAPSMQNFGDISFTNNSDYKYIVEAEGIYIGYKYYETRYEDAVLGAGNAVSAKGSSFGGAWNYADEVVFPFGFGLSYTQFAQTLKSVEYDEANDVYNVTVTVTNTGEVPGKCSVQVYAQTPYDGIVESPAIRLVGFNKTFGKTESGEKETAELTSREAGMLYPGESEDVIVEVDRYLLTSYNEGARGGKGGYVLTEGDYYLAIGENIHDALNNILAVKGASGLFDQDGNSVQGNVSAVYELGEWPYDEDSYSISQYTETTVENKLERTSLDYWTDQEVTFLSRSDWDATYPELVELTLTDAMKKEMDGGVYETDTANAPAKGTYLTEQKNGIDFIDMKDVPFSGTYEDADGNARDADEMWNKFLDQLSLDELAAATTNSSANPAVSINAPRATETDGPDGAGGTMENGMQATCYPSQIVAASTFNPKTLRMRGDFEGEDGLFTKISVLWSPGGNIHRTPYSGRNFEYYSECGYMGYLCASFQVPAMQAKGLICSIKHFVGNNQETNRHNVSTFNTEQSWRENSLKIFEGAMAKGGALGVMTALSNIGCTPAPANAEMNIDIVMDEWGFKGINITDGSNGQDYMDSIDMLMNGTTMYCLDNRESDLKRAISRGQNDDVLEALRQANKQFYYTMLRSNAANGIAPGATVSSGTPWWKSAAIVIDCVIGAAAVAAAGAYVYFLVKGTRNKEEEKKNG